MPCFAPLKAYKAPGGGISFKAPGAFFDRPLELPCGQCIGCRSEKSRQWALRITHEALLHEKNAFITLTFDDRHFPKDASLDVKHWQKFARKLRKKIGPFRYFACGEYGGEKLRPHYHACLFGHDFTEDRVLLETDNDYLEWTSPTVESAWSNQGFVQITELNYTTAHYCAKYILTKKTGKQADETYERPDPVTGELYTVKPEFSVMSRRPGIGANWIKRFPNDVYPHDNVIQDGKSFRPPRYYDDYLKRLKPDLLADLKRKRRRAARDRSEELTDKRLHQRHQIAKRRANRKQRNF